MKVKELYLTLSLMYTKAHDIRVRIRYGETAQMKWKEFAEKFGEWFILWYDPSIDTITIVRKERDLYEVERHDEH